MRGDSFVESEWPYQSHRRWVQTMHRWLELFAEPVAVDSRLRGKLAFAKHPYLRPRRTPLAEAVRPNEAELGAGWQADVFGIE